MLYPQNYFKWKKQRLGRYFGGQNTCHTSFMTWDQFLRSSVKTKFIAHILVILECLSQKVWSGEDNSRVPQRSECGVCYRETLSQTRQKGRPILYSDFYKFSVPNMRLQMLDIYTKVYTLACTHTNMPKSLKKYVKIIVKYK